MVQPTRTRISAEAYFLLPEYAEHELIQLIDGEIIIGTPSTPRHQDIVREIIVLLALFARENGGKAYTSPIEVVLDAHNIFEPDVLYLKPDSQCKVEEKRLIGAPDLVVEVLSPSTAKIDRQQKYHAYEQNGVGEYWIVDPVHEVIEVRTRNNGEFARQGAYDSQDTFTSKTLAHPVNVKAIFDT